MASSPYTHCVFNAHIGIIGVARKTSLAPTAKAIADRIQQLLGEAEVALAYDLSVQIAPIPDPDDFVRTLESAYRVSRFTATFHGPNPFDADELFQKPLSVYLSAADGTKGKVEIQGEDLNRDVLQSVARSTAATGNEASARINRERSHRSMTVNLAGDPIKRTYEEGAYRPEDVLQDLTELYYQIRRDHRVTSD